MNLWEQSIVDKTILNERSNDWKKAILEEIADIKGRIGWRGYTVDDLKDSGPLVIGGTQIVCNKLDLSKPVFISEDKYNESPEIKVKKHDIILTKTGNSIGDVALINKDIGKATINPNVALIRTKPENCPAFLFYLLVSNDAQHYIKSSNTGSAQPAVNQNSLKKYEFLLPSPSEQKDIASVLLSLDDKIDFLHQQNKTLESISQAIFRHWFVDFEFTNKEGKPYKATGGIMTESELGEIPEGWRVGKLEDLVEIKNGFAFKSEDYINEKQYPIIRTMNFEDSGFINDRGLVYLSYENAEGYRHFNFVEFDLCVVMVGASLGKTALVTKKNLPALQNQNMWSFRPKRECFRFYNNLQIKTLIDKNIRSASGSARDFFRKDHFYDIRTLIPSELVVIEFEKIIKPIYLKISSNLLYINTLVDLREMLLPKLIKGDLRVGGE